MNLRYLFGIAGIAGSCFLSSYGTADFQRTAALPSYGHEKEFLLLLRPGVKGALSENIYIPHYERAYQQQKSTMPSVPSEKTLDSYLLEFNGCKTVRQAVYDALRKKDICMIGKGLDDLTMEIKKQKGWLTRDKVFKNGELDEQQRTFSEDLIPDYYKVEDMDLEIKIDKSEFNLKLIQHYNNQEIVHVDATVCIGRKGCETPAGTFYIKRIVWWPSWYDPLNNGKRHNPGIHNAFGAVMAEICRGEEPSTGYGMAVPGDTGRRIHSMPPAKFWSIGYRDSLGCIRVHPEVAVPIYEFIETYLGEKEGKKTARGNRIVLLKEPIPVLIVE